VRAVLERVEGRRLQFTVAVADGDRPVAKGLVTRVVVDAAAFLRSAGAGMASRVPRGEITGQQHKVQPGGG